MKHIQLSFVNTKKWRHYYDSSLKEITHHCCRFQFYSYLIFQTNIYSYQCFFYKRLIVSSIISRTISSIARNILRKVNAYTMRTLLFQLWLFNNNYWNVPKTISWTLLNVMNPTRKFIKKYLRLCTYHNQHFCPSNISN